MAKVLVVDDERGIRELLSDKLAEAGHEVIEAGDGQTALERAWQESPDVILLDVLMPVMDGLQALARLRQDPATEGIPVILLTAFSPLKGEQTAIELGVSHYITKPWAPGTVECAVRLALHEVGALEEPEGEARFTTGNVQLDGILGGGIPPGSLTLIEGAASSGKSILCQHIAYGVVERGQGVAFFTGETTPKNLITQMSSIGLEVLDDFRDGKLSIYPMDDAIFSDPPDSEVTALVGEIDRLPRQNKVVIVDAITSFVSHTPPLEVMNFFSECRKLCQAGRTLLLVAHSYAFDERILERVLKMCDSHLKLGIERMGTKLVKTVEVCKLESAGPDSVHGGRVFFEIVPGLGLRVLPGGKVKV